VSVVARASGPANTPLCRLLQVDYQVRSVVRIGQTGVRHAIADDDLLRTGDELVEGLHRPGDAAVFHGCRIAEVRDFGGLAAEQAVQAWTDAILALHERVAGGTFVKFLFPARGITIGARRAGRGHQANVQTTRSRRNVTLLIMTPTGRDCGRSA
jgi:hypothetical protein